MIYNIFTDSELRRVLDNDPDCAAARDEAARRFVLQNETPEESALEEARREGYGEGWDAGYEEAYDVYADK